jgi:hypothetical protein
MGFLPFARLMHLWNPQNSNQMAKQGRYTWCLKRDWGCGSVGRVGDPPGEGKQFK